MRDGKHPSGRAVLPHARHLRVRRGGKTAVSGNVSETRFVIAGGGIAGTTAAEELRKRLPDAQITLVSEEFHPLYSRVLIPHYLQGKVPRERVFLKKAAWYAQNRIEWLAGTFAQALDTKNAFVTLSDGRELEYDKLLIATGGQPRPADLEGRNVCHMQTVDDADHILKLLDEASYPSPLEGEGMGEVGREPRGVVYGGGFIACEFVDLFASRALPIEVRLRGDRFFSSSLDGASWEMLRTKLESSGVTLVTNCATSPLERGSMRGSVPADSAAIVGLGLGLEAELSWIREGGVEVGQGVKANEYLETNAPNVWTAGDVAEFFDLSVGRQRMVGSWMNAQMQGRCVAANMAGERQPFCLVSSFATQLLGTPITFVGDVMREKADETKVLGDAATGIVQLFGRKGKLVGATLVGTATARQAATTLIKEGRLITDFSLK
ncbi:hypothetical protein EPO34_03315 [Patescibacteria group bacterium]|nr:MAG: hypothetical protein EPO34_03315 [Patescibacteria group bacterium]